MDISRHKIKLALGLVLLSLIFVCLRLKALNHLLMWDEARNIISLRAFLSNTKSDPFYWNYFFHPPLYMVFAGMLAPFKAGLAMRLELLSLLFSYATLFFVYLLSAKIGGWRYALLSGLFLSVMPASIAYDTWIKRDGLAAALGYLAVFLLVKRRFFWCAVALSFSLLTKESALFFLFAIAVTLLIFKEKELLKKSLVFCGVSFVLSGWWYLFFSAMPREVLGWYLLATKATLVWANSPLYYFKRLLPDMGLPALLFFITGVSYFAHLAFRKRQYKWLVPIVIILCVYIPSSFIVTAKAPWLCLAAVPALAMTAGGGALFLVKQAGRSKPILAVLAAFLIILAGFGGFFFSYDKYYQESYPNGWNGANSSRALAFYLNEHMKDGERLMTTQFSYWGLPECTMCPVFLYYWKGGEVYVIDGKDKTYEVMREVSDKKISWLAVIDSSNERYNFHGLVKGLSDSTLGTPSLAGQAYVWKTDSLWE
ncbi:MAG: hypothetical protein PHX20_01290 [Candidatus Omnitrophica bacterium]|nr:hypothetical protein [Candidatus Omnitrophota bacterium]